MTERLTKAERANMTDAERKAYVKAAMERDMGKDSETAEQKKKRLAKEKAAKEKAAKEKAAKEAAAKAKADKSKSGTGYSLFGPADRREKAAGTK